MTLRNVAVDLALVLASWGLIILGLWLMWRWIC